MKDFLSFKRMLMPVLIQIVFWLGIVVCIITGIINLIRTEWVLGVEVLILGPILVRIACELLILFFRINETLTDINRKLSA